jgi:probable rRNA maturation factor
MELPSSSFPDILREASPIVTVADRGWHRIVARVEALAVRAAREAGNCGAILLANDKLMRRLNARHRGRNLPTNVLAFEQPAPEIVLALGVICREAAAVRRPPAHHLAHLIVHGTLHLRGFNHHRPGDARRMEMTETRILHRLGVPNPWKRT